MFDGAEDDGESASAECFDFPQGDEAGEGGGDDEGEEGVFLVVEGEGGAVAGFEAGPVAVEGGAVVGDEEWTSADTSQRNAPCSAIQT
ncbi:hypothetical protein [Streptomyces uncialis]|uniref:hypothetical protein n=1 Tax=Streptomyces uncialis TaxID=1048205 RepID=UPI003792E2B3